MSDTQTSIVQNRSEIIFIFDAVDTNPNGDPKSAGNRPRIDPETGQCIVTDVRLKRYLRDQLADDGHGVYIRRVDDEDGDRYTREQLLADRLDEIDPENIDSDDLADAVFAEFLDASSDVRYFGATLSVDGDEQYVQHLPDHFTGPVQFSPGKSMHPVELNENYSSLSSVIATQDDKQGGGFDLDDHRVQYAAISMHGIVDENNAADTHLSTADVERLDTLCWRALKNQTNTRSKAGQEPRVYVRVEYEEDSYHIGGLHHDISIDEDRSEPFNELRNIRDLAFDATDFVSRLESHQDSIKTVNIVVDDVAQFSVGDEIGNGDFLIAMLEESLGAEKINEVDVLGEFEETLPEEPSATAEA